MGRVDIASGGGPGADVLILSDSNAGPARKGVPDWHGGQMCVDVLCLRLRYGLQTTREFRDNGGVVAQPLKGRDESQRCGVPTKQRGNCIKRWRRDKRDENPGQFLFGVRYRVMFQDRN